MMGCSPVSTCAKSVVHFTGRIGSNLRGVVSHGASSSCCYFLSPGYSKTKYTDFSGSSEITGSPAYGSQVSHDIFLGSCIPRRRSKLHSLTVKASVSDEGYQKRHLEISLACQSMNVRVLVPKHGAFQKIKCNVGPLSWPRGCASAGLIFGLLVCCSSSEAVHAEPPGGRMDKDDNIDSSHDKFSHGKKVCVDYSVIGIPGDGRCLFRSVAHGACLRSGKPAPNESLQRELADDLRTKVADEFIERKEETEWFIEGDFDTYVSQIRKPHVWGGEPELFIASHVLQMPITVYMYDKDAGGLISIAEYGHEYGKDNPICVLYHGFGHYDALQIPGRKHGKSKL